MPGWVRDLTKRKAFKVLLHLRYILLLWCFLHKKCKKGVLWRENVWPKFLRLLIESTNRTAVAGLGGGGEKEEEERVVGGAGMGKRGVAAAAVRKEGVGWDGGGTN